MKPFTSGFKLFKKRATNHFEGSLLFFKRLGINGVGIRNRAV